MSDEAERKAGEVLPCKCHHILGGAYTEKSLSGHIDRCPAYYRPAVAALLREREAEIERLKAIKREAVKAFDQAARETEKAEAELASLRSRLGEAEKSAQDQIDLYAAGEAQAKREAVESKRLLEGREAQAQAARVEALREAQAAVMSVAVWDNIQASDAYNAIAAKIEQEAK